MHVFTYLGLDANEREAQSKSLHGCIEKTYELKRPSPARLYPLRLRDAFEELMTPQVRNHTRPIDKGSALVNSPIDHVGPIPSSHFFSRSL